MPKLPRETVKQFGTAGVSTDFGEFGSKFNGTPATSQDPATIMSLANWGVGWVEAAVGGNFNPFLEDMNGFCLAAFYFLANIFERGVPDYAAGTTYYLGAVVQDPAGTGQMWQSLQDSNLGNAPPASNSSAFWRWTNPPAAIVSGALPVGTVPKLAAGTTPANVGAPSSQQLVAGLLTDDAVNVNIGGVFNTNGLKFPDGSIQYKAALSSSVTSRQVYAPGGARSPGTPYVAPSGPGSKPIFVSASFNVGGAQPIEAKVNGVVVDQSGSTSGVTGIYANVGFWVFPGETYEIDAPGGLVAMIVWTEVS